MTELKDVINAKIPDSLASAKSSSYQDNAPDINGKRLHELDFKDLKSKVVTGAYSSKLFSKMQKFEGKPDADVKVYRASPSETLNKSDWVTLDKDYAKRIKGNDKTVKLNEHTVKASDLRHHSYNGDLMGQSFNFGYYPGKGNK